MPEPTQAPNQNILQSPFTRQPLVPDPSGRFLADLSTGQKFRLDRGLLVIPDPQESSTVSREARKWFDLLGVALTYDYRIKQGLKKRGVDEHQMRQHFVGQLGIKDGDRVLEISMGTGSNIPYFSPTIHFVGLDISRNMLRVAQKKARKFAGEVLLIWMDASKRLPFIDRSFDVVFHMAGIQFFADPAGCIAEMIRVAKPGTKILVADEAYTLPATLGRAGIQPASNTEENLKKLFGLLPAGVTDPASAMIYNGELYCLSFCTSSEH